MRKILLLLFSVLCLGIGRLAADNVTAVLTGPDSYEIISLSKNGKYAALYDGSGGALWDIEKNVITYLTNTSVTTYVNGVSNNGIVVGQFAFEGLDEDSEGITVTGGIYKNGEYIPLLDENGEYIESTGYGISPNGEYISGCIWESEWATKPALWDNTGKLIRYLTVEDNTYNYANAAHVTDDGTCGGWYYHTISSGKSNRQACIWTPDNEIVGVTEDEEDISGYYYLNGFSEDGKLAIASIGRPEDDSIYIATGAWRKGVVWDVENSKTLRDIPYSNLQVLNNGIASFNATSDDDSGMTDCYLDIDGDTLRVLDFIEDSCASYLPSANDQHLYKAYFSEDMSIIAGFAYLSDGSDYNTTIWITNLSEYADVVNLQAQTLPQIDYKVMLRWSQPLVSYDNVINYHVYGRVAESDEWQYLAEVEADIFSCVVDVPEGVVDSMYYKVTCVYDEQESEGVTVGVSTADFNMGYGAAPADIAAYVYNYNDVSLSWKPANTGASAIVGWHDGELAENFGANTTMTFQAGTLFDKDVSAAYSEQYKLAGIQFYFNTPCDTLGIVLYNNYVPFYEQTIDQDTLTECSWNAVMLDSLLTLPTNGEFMAAVRVVQTGVAEPIGLDAGPAVEGGDMLSEDDGATWSTMRSLSSNAYDRNFLISLMLTDGTTPEVTSYTVYRDGEAVSTVATSETAYEYIDKAVAVGNHTYSVGAVWDDSSEGKASSSVLVSTRGADRCPAPANVAAELSSDSTKVTVTWEMPRQSEVTYSNWDYVGTGTIISGYTGWFLGVQYTALRMKPYIGGTISEVRYYPTTDCDLAIHIYENDEEVGYMDIEDYVEGTINSAVLTEPVEIKSGCEYIVAIEGFDVDADNDAFFLGNDTGTDCGYNVYSEDGETYYNDTYTNCNYMMGIIVTVPGDNSDAAITYNVNIDSVAVAENLTEFSYTADISAITEPAFDINVGAVYSIGEKMSNDIQIVLDEEALGITNITANGGITFVGGVISFGGALGSARIYSLDGRTIAGADGVSSFSTKGIAPGVYVMKTIVNGEENSVKVRIK